MKSIIASAKVGPNKDILVVLKWSENKGFYAIVEASGPRALIQGSWTAVPQNGPGYLSQGAGLLTLGFQVPVGSTWVWELALTEEFLTWATMEVGFQAGLVGLF